MSLKIDPRAKALIFDIDGTLADTMPIHYQAWQEIGRRHNFTYPSELFYELAGIPTPKIVPLLNERLGLKLDPVEIVKEKEGVFFNIIGEIKPIMPVVDLVHQNDNRLPVALGTGGRREIAQMTIKAVGLEDCFKIMVAAEDVLNHKPAPDTFLKCAELMGVAPEYCQVFEDGELGISAAYSAGMIVTDVRPFIV